MSNLFALKVGQVERPGRPGYVGSLVFNIKEMAKVKDPEGYYVSSKVILNENS